MYRTMPRASPGTTAKANMVIHLFAIAAAPAAAANLVIYTFPCVASLPLVLKLELYICYIYTEPHFYTGHVVITFRCG